MLFDFGHIDLFTAEDAPELAWQPLLNWLEERHVGDHDDEQCDDQHGSSMNDEWPNNLRHDQSRTFGHR